MSECEKKITENYLEQLKERTGREGSLIAVIFHFSPAGESLKWQIASSVSCWRKLSKIDLRIFSNLHIQHSTVGEMKDRR